ncbi:MAG: scaffolding protein [Bacteriophage sp.]|nr:MAG: scaffolding protein [Bacteriophage sp.]
MATRSREWSRRARRDFDEREDYRRRNDEEDRYRRKDDDERSEDAREDRREERGWYDKIEEQLRNGTDETDYDGLYQQLRERFEWYEEELDRYDADYDDLMAEVDKLRNDNRRYRMRGSRDDRPGKEEMEREQKEDIKDDGKELSFDDLWKKAEKED